MNYANNALVPIAFLLPFTAMAQQSRPNLVLVIADQFTGTAMGCAGDVNVKTPNLDRIASQGVLFNDAVSCYPVSSPARGMLMTGMYPHRSGVPGNCNSENAPYGVELPTSAVTWSDILHSQGYSMGYIGKWHLDSPHEPYVNTYNNRGKVKWNEWCPPSRRHGFDFWVAYGTYDWHLRPMYWEGDASRDDYFFVEEWGPEYEVDRAIGFLDDVSQSGNPFALVVSMNPPHTGYELVPEKYKDIYKDMDVDNIASLRPDVQPIGTENGKFFRKYLPYYYACISGVDENVGRLYGALEEKGLSDNTIFIFTSDHGVCLGTHGIQGKDVWYEEAMRIPMIMVWPNRISPRVDNDTMISFGDLYPTMLSLMGLSSEIPHSVMERDYSKEVLHGTPKAKALKSWQPYYRLYPSDSGKGSRGIRGKRYTFVVEVEEGTVSKTHLYDRQTDPYQMKDVSKENPRIVRRCTRILKKHLSRTGDPFLKYLH